MNERTALFVGSTSALGQSLAATYAQKGWNLILATRDVVTQAEIAADLRLRYQVIVHEIPYQATDTAGFTPCTEKILQWGCPRRIFFLTGDPGEPASDILDPERVLYMSMVNYVGIASFLAKLYPAIILEKKVRIVLIGSVAGDRGRAVNPLYCAAKASLDVYAQAMRQRLYQHGVRITLVRLGYVDSRLSYGLTPPWLTLSSRDAARQICQIADKTKDTNIIYIPRWWSFVMLLIRLIPESLWKRLPHF